MGKELLLVIETVANEKGVDREDIFGAMEAALAMATKKIHGNAEMDARVSIDRSTGEYDTNRCWTVVEDDLLENEEAEIALSAAKKDYPELEVGDVIEEHMDSIEFGRIAAQTAKQVIVQKVREAEREKIVAQYEKKIGTLVAGSVKRVTRDFISIDLGDDIDAMIPRSEGIPKEAFRTNDRVRACLLEIRRNLRGIPQLILSRACNEMLIELMRLEVPEISEEVIAVKAVARDPGLRSKVAVKTNDGRIDPIGACVGMRGSRVQSISNELGGERVEMILWDDNPAQLVINAISPVEVASIVMDEDSNSMDVAVQEDQLSQAIGRGGQNVKLVRQLTGWKVNVMAEDAAQEKQQAEAETLVQMFVDGLSVEKDVAILLVESGLSSVEEIAYIPSQELLEIEGFDEELVDALRERAKNALLAGALTGDKVSAVPSVELLNMDGMTKELAHKLAKKGITTVEGLADLSIDELMEVEGIDEELAGDLIMIAREPWFKKEETH